MEQTAGGPASPTTRTLCQRPRVSAAPWERALLAVGASWHLPARSEPWVCAWADGCSPCCGSSWHQTAPLGQEGVCVCGGRTLADYPVFPGDNVTAAGPGEGELAKDLLLRAERSPLGPAKGKKAGRRRDGPNCTVRRLMVKVRDLGLGFDSDEIVPFKYCSGSCHRSRSNYDLTLATLLQEKAIKPGPPGHVASHPCCRPTRYEAVSFMNVQNTWQTVEKLSAAECKCIG
uniref:Artemin n=1 Tax=Chrysemys picta bellii TaxID=8478 RepID=A0A8C3F752_CHRPI